MFKYESFLKLCFRCGRVGHFDKYYEHKVPNVNNNYLYSIAMVEEQIRLPRLTSATTGSNNSMSRVENIGTPPQGRARVFLGFWEPLYQNHRQVVLLLQSYYQDTSGSLLRWTLPISQFVTY
ncbi:hypothetical protein COP2_000014 [Malus domestica]